MIPTCRATPLERVLTLYRSGLIRFELPTIRLNPMWDNLGELQVVLRIPQGGEELKRAFDSIYIKSETSPEEAANYGIATYYYHAPELKKIDFCASMRKIRSGPWLVKIYGEGCGHVFTPLEIFLQRMMKELEA